MAMPSSLRSCSIQNRKSSKLFACSHPLCEIQARQSAAIMTGLRSSSGRKLGTSPSSCNASAAARMACALRISICGRMGTVLFIAIVNRLGDLCEVRFDERLFEHAALARHGERAVCNSLRLSHEILRAHGPVKIGASGQGAQKSFNPEIVGEHQSAPSGPVLYISSHTQPSVYSWSITSRSYTVQASFIAG